MQERLLYQTASRRKITELLQKEHRYMTASAIFEAVKRLIPKLAKSTVYRTVDLLEEEGLLMSRVQPDGETSYIYHVAHHHHAICRFCGYVADIGCGAIEAISRRLREQGFEVDGHSIELSGRCGACRA